MIFIDFETYFSREYSLRRMPILEYILDPRFKVHGCAVAVAKGPSVWLPPERIPALARHIAATGCPVAAHNAMFDCGILSYVYGVVPKAVVDTASMARAAGHETVSLADVGRRLGLGNKRVEVLESLCGVEEPAGALSEEMRAYARADVELCRSIYERLVCEVPQEEARLISWTVRLFLRRTLTIDAGILRQYCDEHDRYVSELLRDLGVEAKELRSRERLVELFAARGVAVPTKAGKAKDVPAFARGDQWMQDLLRRPEQDPVRKLAEARLEVASSIGPTRARRLLDIARTIDAFGPQLQYWGAHTGRWSGAGGLNFQNLPGVQDRRAGRLRFAIRPAIDNAMSS